MKLFGREFEGRAKVLVILVAVLLIASGLCGVQIAIDHWRKQGLDEVVAISIVTGAVELGLMVLSAAGIVVLLITWAISRTFGTGEDAHDDNMPSILQVTSRSDEQEKPSPEEREGRDE